MQLTRLTTVVIIGLLLVNILIGLALAQIANVDGTPYNSIGVPSLSSCGTSPSLAAGSTNSSGTINVGSGVTLGCTLTFSITYSTPPSCIVGTSLSTVVPGWTVTANALTITMSLTLGNGKLYYFCPGL